jgi:MATE family multidrug resistance protein
VLGLLAIPVNLAAAWVLMFGKLGLPALGLVGAGVATTVSSTFMFAGLALVVSLDRRMRRYRLFGRFWRADWPRFR